MICSFANKLYQNRTPATFINKAYDEVDGVKIIGIEDVDAYIKKTKLFN